MYILSTTTVHITRTDTCTFKYTHSKIYYVALDTIKQANKQTNKHMCMHLSFIICTVEILKRAYI